MFQRAQIRMYFKSTTLFLPSYHMQIVLVAPMRSLIHINTYTTFISYPEKYRVVSVTYKVSDTSLKLRFLYFRLDQFIGDLVVAAVLHTMRTHPYTGLHVRKQLIQSLPRLRASSKQRHA